MSREILCRNGGIPKEIFEQMISLLPKDYSIIGFGEDRTNLLSYMFIKSDSFVDTPELVGPPDITPWFRREVKDGVQRDFCEKIDFGNALQAQAICIHHWVPYVGVMNRYDYCSICGVKK